jgi:molybdopterin converting factor small subunit
MVTVLLFGQSLKDTVGASELQFEITEGTTLKSLIDANPDPLEGLRLFLAKSEVLVTVNRKVAVIDSPIHDGDTIKLTHQTNPIFDGARWHNP